MSPSPALPPDPNPLRDPKDRRLTRVAGPSALVLFGVTGDLAQKKLLPAIYDLMNRGLLPPSFALVGFGRRDWSDERFQQVVRESVEAHSRTPFREDVWHQLTTGIRFVQGAFDDGEAFRRLGETLAELDETRGTQGNHAFYLSIPPNAFETVCQQLADRDLADSENSTGWRRVVIEKPFGHDRDSARELNDIVGAVFPTDSVFRIDHYLGKETVQNILALRFANQMFEPVWNSHYVDHVQITMAEDIGIGGRAGYYDGIGAARDVIQNHLLQLLAITAMEQPLTFDAKDLRTEKEKVLAAVRLPEDLSTATARGQYAGGWQGGEEVTGFLADVRASVEVAKRLDAKWMTVVPGFLDKRLPLDIQTGRVIDAMRRAGDILEPHGLVLVMEPLNTRTDHPGMFMQTVAQGYAVAKGANSPSVKVLADLYHEQIQSGNLIPTMGACWDEIAYIQVGDNPGRKEPGTGEVSYTNVVRWLRGQKYAGVIGMEHGNSLAGRVGEERLIAAYREIDRP